MQKYQYSFEIYICRKKKSRMIEQNSFVIEFNKKNARDEVLYALLEEYDETSCVYC